VQEGTSCNSFTSERKARLKLPESSQNGCTEKTAYEKLTAAWRQRNRLLPTPSNDKGEDWEQDDDLLPVHWDYVALL